MALNQDSNGGQWAQQDKDAFLSYSFDWSDWLSAGDSIATSTWATDAALILNSAGLSGTVTTIWVQGGAQNNWYAVTNTVITTQGRRNQRTFRLFIVDDTATATVSDGSLLFKNRSNAIDDMRRDRMMVAASGAMPSVEISDDYIWSKIKAAEAEIARLLRVPLVPTQFFPKDPTPEQIAALPAGMPWGIDPGYDYSPDFFQGDRFGLTKLRNKPIVSISSLAFAYPSAISPAFTFPIEWLRIDKKYGQVQIVPTTSAYMATMNTFVLQSLSSGRQIPLALEFTYIAGLTDAVNNWPDLIDLIKKKAVLSIIEDTFIPASGSISADGLSQSMSVQMDQYHDMIDRKLYGPNGSNGGLMSAIHGIRVGGMLG